MGTLALDLRVTSHAQVDTGSEYLDTRRIHPYTTSTVLCYHV